MKNIKKMKLALVAFAMLIGVAVLAPAATYASTASEIEKGVIAVGGANETPIDVRFQSIVNIMLYVLGALAVIMIVVGGIRYVTSTGDASRVKAAKDTVMYAVIGLVVAILAYAIVNFVVRSFK